MFQSVPCTLDLSKRFGREYPDFCHSVRFEYEKRLHPAVKFDLYSYTKCATTYYYGIKWQEYIANNVIACCLGPYIEEDYVEGFQFFSRAVKIFDTKETLLFITDEHLAEAIVPLCAKFKMAVKRYPTINYYISEKQEKILLDKEPLPVPEGYELGKSRIEDASLTTSCWRHNAPGEEDQMRLKIANFPATCIRYQGKPVAFETTHSCGMLSHLYVDPGHRGKNLGHIVQEDMARQLIKQGLYVYKSVETFNTAVIRGTDRWDLWSMRKKPDGSPLIKMFLDIYAEK